MPVRVRVITESKLVRWFFPRDVVAFTLGRTIRVRAADISLRTYTHELVHVRQYIDAGGVVPFLVKYLWLSLRKGYFNNPLEVEAYEHESDVTPNTPPR